MNLSQNIYNQNSIGTRDRLVREKERLQITSISRSQAYLLEKQGKYPRRIRLGARSVAWRESELLAWVESPQNEVW